MVRYFLPLLTVLLLLPLTVSAANEVHFTEDTNLYIADDNATVVVQDGSQVDAISVDADSIDITMSSASGGITLTSDDRYTLSNTWSRETQCGAALSTLRLYAPSSTSTVSVTIGEVCAETAGGGGGGVTKKVPSTKSGMATASATSGGEAKATTAEGASATVNVPAGAVSSDTTITITPTTTGDIAVGYPSPTGFNVVGGYAYDLSASSDGEDVTTFSSPVTLTFTYTEAQVAGINESTLGVYRWDGTQWVALPTTVNTASNTLVATTTEFSYFAIMGGTGGMTAAGLQAEIARILALITQLQAQLAQMTGGEGLLAANLSYDDSGDAVKLLQTWLAKDSSVYPEAIVSGWFGPLTKAAVIRFQEKYTSEILAPWGLTQGNGFVGQKTRDKLNALYGGM
jgi:hypothetical protein